MLFSVESTEKFDSTIAFDCSDEEFKIDRGITAPSIAQNDSKRTTENSATDKGTAGLRSIGCDREEIRPDEHVRQKFSEIRRR